MRVQGYGKTATCGGTLVSARWVMTAGHCVTAPDLSVLPADAFNDSKSSNKLRVGSVDHKTGGFTSDVDGVIRIPTYNNPAAGTQPTYDLGLLHLKDAAPQEPLPLIDGSPADIPFWSPGVAATVLGWGRTADASSSPKLLQAQVPIVSDGDCSAAWPAPSAGVPSPFSAPSMVCAGGTTTDSCEGDSGGPLIAARNGAATLVGVTSWGSGPQCAAGRPGVYVRLGDPAINEWVRSWVAAVVLTSSAATAVVSEPVEFSGAALGSGDGRVGHERRRRLRRRQRPDLEHVLCEHRDPRDRGARHLPRRRPHGDRAHDRQRDGGATASTAGHQPAWRRERDVGTGGHRGRPRRARRPPRPTRRATESP